MATDSADKPDPRESTGDGGAHRNESTRDLSTQLTLQAGRGAGNRLKTVFPADGRDEPRRSFWHPCREAASLWSVSGRNCHVHSEFIRRTSILHNQYSLSCPVSEGRLELNHAADIAVSPTMDGFVRLGGARGVRPGSRAILPALLVRDDQGRRGQLCPVGWDADGPLPVELPDVPPCGRHASRWLLSSQSTDRDGEPRG
jgi:hypothetical protein